MKKIISILSLCTVAFLAIVAIFGVDQYKWTKDFE